MLDLTSWDRIDLILVRLRSLGILLFYADLDHHQDDLSGVQRDMGLLIAESSESAMEMLEQLRPK